MSNSRSRRAIVLNLNEEGDYKCNNVVYNLVGRCDLWGYALHSGGL